MLPLLPPLPSLASNDDKKSSTPLPSPSPSRRSYPRKRCHSRDTREMTEEVVVWVLVARARSEAKDRERAKEEEEKESSIGR